MENGFRRIAAFATLALLGVVLSAQAAAPIERAGKRFRAVGFEVNDRLIWLEDLTVAPLPPKKR